MDYTQKVRKFIVDNFLFGDSNDLEDGTSFIEGGIIDSTGMLELVNFLEETFEIRVEDQELVPENLDSIGAVVSYLKRKRNGSCHNGSHP